jgi:hypothetical protein
MFFAKLIDGAAVLLRLFLNLLAWCFGPLVELLMGHQLQRKLFIAASRRNLNLVVWIVAFLVGAWVIRAAGYFCFQAGQCLDTYLLSRQVFKWLNFGVLGLLFVMVTFNQAKGLFWLSLRPSQIRVHIRQGQVRKTGLKGLRDQIDALVDVAVAAETKELVLDSPLLANTKTANKVAEIFCSRLRELGRVPQLKLDPPRRLSAFFSVFAGLYNREYSRLRPGKILRDQGMMVCRRLVVTIA